MTTYYWIFKNLKTYLDDSIIIWVYQYLNISNNNNIIIIIITIIIIIKIL